MKKLPVFGILLVLQIYLLNNGFYSISADEAGHILEAYRFYNGDVHLFSIWLPFVKIFYGLLFYIHYDLFWIPRIASMAAGHALLFFIMLLSGELFTEKTAMVSGFIASVFVGTVVFSVVPLTEIYFFLCLVVSVYLLIRYLRTGKYLLLLFLLVIINTTDSLRGMDVRFYFLHCIME